MVMSFGLRCYMTNLVAVVGVVVVVVAAAVVVAELVRGWVVALQSIDLCHWEQFALGILEMQAGSKEPYSHVQIVVEVDLRN